MRDLFTRLPTLDQLGDAIRQPARHPREVALLVVGIIGVIVLFIVIALVVFLAREINRRLKARGIVLKVTRQMALIALAVMAGLTLVSGVAGLVYSSNPSFCALCHSGEHTTWRYSSHEKFSCARCHQEPGLAGLAAEKTSLWHMAWVEATDRPAAVRADVPNARCKKCHVVLKKSVVSGGIRMSHAQPEAGGYWCTDCHNAVPHRDAVPVKNAPTMDKCIKCHNDRQASAACLTCHSDDVGEKRTTSIANYPKVQLPRTVACKGCHDLEGEGCTSCHGVEMPHPQEWMSELTHAKAAAFDKKEVCFKCHDRTMFFCNQCHKFPGHSPEWKQIHSEGGFASEPTCMSCHTKEMSPVFCALCH